MKSITNLFLALTLMAAGSFTEAHADSPIKTADFVKRPTYSNAKISPGGEYLAITVDGGEQDVLTVMRMSDFKILKINQLPEKRSIGSFYWVAPNRLMFNSVKKMGGYAMPLPTGEWFAVNADGSHARPLIFYGTRDATQRAKSVGLETFSLVDTLPENDREVIMQARYPRSSEGAGAELVRMDTYSGRRISLARAPKSNCSMALDNEKLPRFAVCSSTRDENGEYDEHTELYKRDGLSWKLMNSSKSEGKHLWIEKVADDGTIYVSESDGRKPDAIGTLDTETMSFSKLFQDDVADISEKIWSTDDNILIGAITRAGAPKVHLLNESHADSQVYASLSQSFPGQLVEFVNSTDDGKQIIVSVLSDRNPGELYLFDRSTGKARFLMKSRPWLEPTKMSSIKPFRITSRDGKQIYGYLTFPSDHNKNKKLPMIVNPHGGPIGTRDDWRFNPEAQLLANRGYAVLQINFRGSGGYGKAFQDSGHEQWSNGIQNDIIDATKWAIDEGYADRDNICIYGGSFGAYSALMAPILAPNLFQCAFGYVGVYDLEMMFERGDIHESENGLRFLRHTLGVNKIELARGSPARRASEIKIPVYLAAGARDMRAPPEQTELMARMLTQAGNVPEGIIIQPSEMHGYYDESNRINLYTKMLEFFSNHLKKSSVEK